MDLKGKKAVITGANRSIGRGIAEMFARHGSDVVISYRSDKEGADSVVKNIKEQGRFAQALYADFSNKKEVEGFFAEALASLGQIDILVNCAAGYDRTPFLDLDANVFENLLQIGVVAPMMLTQLVAKHMIENGNIKAAHNKIVTIYKKIDGNFQKNILGLLFDNNGWNLRLYL